MAVGKHQAIRNAVAAAYAAGTALSARIMENRELALPDGAPSQIQVYCVESIPDRPFVSTFAPVDWNTQLRTVIKTRKDGTTSADELADALLQGCFARLMADQSLGGLCQQLDPGPVTWEADELDSNVVMVSWVATATHRTDSNSIA